MSMTSVQDKSSDEEESDKVADDDDNITHNYPKVLNLGGKRRLFVCSVDGVGVGAVQNENEGDND